MKMTFIGQIDGDTHRLVIDDHNNNDGHYSITLDDKIYEVDAKVMPSAIISAIIDNKSYDLDIDDKDQSKDPLDGKVSIRVRGRVVRLEMLEERLKKMKDAKDSVFSHHGPLPIKSPMPGKILRFLVNEGDAVKKGQGLVVMEAMKMENELLAPKDGIIKEFSCKINSTVEGGITLLMIE